MLTFVSSLISVLIVFYITYEELTREAGYSLSASQDDRKFYITYEELTPFTASKFSLNICFTLPMRN